MTVISMQSKKSYLERIEMDYLVQFAAETKLLKNKRYFTKKDFVLGLSNRLSIEECEFLFKNYEENITPQNTAKIFLAEKNPTAPIVVNKLIHFLAMEKYKEILNNIIFKEFTVGNFRTDVNLINGHSFAFEIKTARDKIEKASIQTENFLKAFEYVYLVMTYDQELPKNLNENVGIYLFDYQDGQAEFKEIQKAKRNLIFDSMIQLNALRKDEIQLFHGDTTGKKDKETMIKELLDTETEMNINVKFKHCLKNRFREQWYDYVKTYILASGKF